MIRLWGDYDNNFAAALIIHINCLQKGGSQPYIITQLQ